MDGSAHGIKAVRSSGKLEKLNSQSSTASKRGVKSRNVFCKCNSKYLTKVCWCCWDFLIFLLAVPYHGYH